MDVADAAVHAYDSDNDRHDDAADDDGDDESGHVSCTMTPCPDSACTNPNIPPAVNVKVRQT